MSPSSSQGHRPRKNPLFLFRRYYMVLVVLLFAMAIGHRWSGLGVYPQPHQTDDEYDYLWAGMSQLNGDPPLGWSFLRGVPQRNLLGHYWMSNMAYPIYRIYLDHPPLFQLATGLTAKAVGVNQEVAELRRPTSTVMLWDGDMSRLRLLSLALFAISFWLMWKWLHLTIGPAAAVIALAIMSFTHSILIHQRLLVADNMVVPCMLGMFVCLERWRRQKISPRVAAAAVMGLSCAAVLSKLMALILVPGVVAWVAALGSEKKCWKPIAWATTGAVSGVVIYVGYACLLDADAFLATMKSQSGRFSDFYGIARMVGNQMEIDAPKLSVWLMGGWILFFACATRLNSVKSTVFAAGLGLVFGYVFFAPKDWYGWHMIPFYTFLCAAWGVGIRQALRNPATLQAAVLVFLLVTEVFSSGIADKSLLHWLRYGYVAVAVLVLMPWGPCRWVSPRQSVIRVMIVALLATGLSLQVAKTRRIQRAVLKGVNHQKVINNNPLIPMLLNQERHSGL